MLTAARCMSKVAEQFVLHVWVPSHHVARECVRIAQGATSQLPDCTVGGWTVVVVVVVVVVVIVIELFHTAMQVWITVCDEPDIYTNKSSKASVT